MMDNQDFAFKAAVKDFRAARQEAALEEIMAKLSGTHQSLVRFEDIIQHLGDYKRVNLGLKKIPLEAIIGSVGRYRDFTRSFLPKGETDADRWAIIKVLMNQGKLPPIEVYQIGEVYFVLDGNHRVSVARSLDQEYIMGYVTEIETNVKFSQTDSPDDFIIKIEEADFLEATQISTNRPKHNISVTVPGQYPLILQYISDHLDKLLKETPGITLPIAAVNWFDTEYMPVINVIRRLGILRDFPERTETDLYIWLTKRRSEIEATLGWNIPIEATASTLLENEQAIEKTSTRISEKILSMITPDAFAWGPKPGKWRKRTLSIHHEDHLFTDILVPISGEQYSWQALDQAILLAKPEGDTIHGLHVVSSKKDLNTENTQLVKNEFEQRLKNAGVSGELTIRTGKIAKNICDLARWTDLVIININNPPGSQIFTKIGSGLHTIIQQCCRPILMVPLVSRNIQKIMLAFDGSPKAIEALYIGTYLAGKWGYELDVLTVNESARNVDRTTQEQARIYLQERGVKANFIIKKGTVSEEILTQASLRRIDVLIMGGYSQPPMLEVLLGSAVDKVLCEIRIPVMLCR